MTQTEITEQEFMDRFVRELVRLGGDEFDDGSSIAEYAIEAAPLYWAEPYQRADGPEACAEADFDCWERS